MTSQSKILLSINEFSQLTGLCEKSVRRLSHVRGFPAVRIGNRVLIHRTSADAWLADCAAHTDDRLPAIQLPTH